MRPAQIKKQKNPCLSELFGSSPLYQISAGTPNRGACTHSAMSPIRAHSACARLPMQNDPRTQVRKQAIARNAANPRFFRAWQERSAGSILDPCSRCSRSVAHVRISLSAHYVASRAAFPGGSSEVLHSRRCRQLVEADRALSSSLVSSGIPAFVIPLSAAVRRCRGRRQGDRATFRSGGAMSPAFRSCPWRARHRADARRSWRMGSWQRTRMKTADRT